MFSILLFHTLPQFFVTSELKGAVTGCTCRCGLLMAKLSLLDLALDPELVGYFSVTFTLCPTSIGMYAMKSLHFFYIHY